MMLVRIMYTAGTDLMSTRCAILYAHANLRSLSLGGPLLCSLLETLPVFQLNS